MQGCVGVGRVCCGVCEDACVREREERAALIEGCDVHRAWSRIREDNSLPLKKMSDSRRQSRCARVDALCRLRIGPPPPPFTRHTNHPDHRPTDEVSCDSDDEGTARPRQNYSVSKTTTTTRCASARFGGDGEERARGHLAAVSCDQSSIATNLPSITPPSTALHRLPPAPRPRPPQTPGRSPPTSRT